MTELPPTYGDHLDLRANAGLGDHRRSGWLVDRVAEQAFIAERIDDPETGTAILLRGPAGAGKSALAENAVQRAGSSRRILRTVGTSPEAELAMAGLYQLLLPLFPLAHQIPGPRQAALRVAFGIAAGPPPDPFAVAMAALDLLVEAAALLAPDELIEDQVRTALDTDVGNWPFERSRMQFLLGARLRRQKRIQEARGLLRAAQAGFDNLGASPWAERARDELRAAGVASHPRAPALWSSLSAQELQVARMVAEGLSNRQIAERLYLSHRTVASHLYRIFPKLGITSRAQLTAMSLDLPLAPVR